MSNTVQQLAQESKQYFRNPLSEFVYYRTYSRWMPEKGRRETWVETVQRYMDFMKENLGDKLTESEYNEVHRAILSQQVMPSMRLLWSAGDAARRTNVAAFNCSFTPLDSFESFSEMLYILTCGTGVGFSVESKYVDKLPVITPQIGIVHPPHAVVDSKEGWADALLIGLKTWYAGEDISFDYSLIRPQGARLKTMGGRASGAEPLKSLLTFTRETILANQGKKLHPIHVHDIACKVGEVVVSGGVRRSALISFSDIDNTEMRHAKDGEFWRTNIQRSMANNSAVYDGKPDPVVFNEEWYNLMRSGSGERGIFNRQAAKRAAMKTKRRDYLRDLLTNPCAEILLRSHGLCNLSEVVCRPDDNKQSLLEKIRVATIIGTYQSTLTKYPYISDEWKKNSEEERLLGVSLTGIFDCPAVRDKETLNMLRQAAIEVNKEYAHRFNIPQSASITCIKPSGSVSQLVDSSSGIHPRHSPYYIRRVRVSASDPLFKMLKEQGFPYKPEVGQNESTATTYVLEFPVKSPEGTTVYRDTMSAIEQLENWKMFKHEYTEHNPSITVSVSDDEWLETGAWVYKNFDDICGISFLPRTNHVYALAPYEEITKEKYEELVQQLPNVDFSNIVYYEQDDETQGAKELACVGGACEIV